MPTGKISEYRFYFRSGEPLQKHEPAHIHVLVAKGKIQFGLDEIKVKKSEGIVTPSEQSKTERIVKEQRNFFLEEGNKIKGKI